MSLDPFPLLRSIPLKWHCLELSRRCLPDSHQTARDARSTPSIHREPWLSLQYPTSHQYTGLIVTTANSSADARVIVVNDVLDLKDC